MHLAKTWSTSRGTWKSETERMAGHAPQSGGSPALCRAIEKTIRGAGLNIGYCQQLRAPEHAREYVVNAVRTATGESWLVHAVNEQQAWIELARQCGIELD